MSARETTGSKRTLQGVVVKNAMNKSIVVETSRRVQHPKYKKYLNKRARYNAHDESNICQIGDQVVLEESRPLSKTKRWRVKEVTVKAV
jgi:small subunit ribosomal protein S17